MGSDWFQRPKEQLERIVAAIDVALAQFAERERTGQLSGRAVPVEVVTVEREDVTEVGLADADGVANPYREATPQVPLGQEMHEVPGGRMAELVEQVVIVEGPVHVDEVVVRLRSAWGLQRAGGRIQGAVERACDIGVQRGRLVRDGGFLSVPGGVVTVRDRALVTSATLRRPDTLPPAELEAAVLQVVRTGLGASADEIGAAVPRLLGFRAVSAQIRQLVRLATDRLEAADAIVREGGLFIVPVTNVV